MSSIFECGLQFHRKTLSPILVHWFLFRFAQITSAKTRRFFLVASFPNKAFAAVAGSGKPAYLHAIFLENKKQNSRKNYSQLSANGHSRKRTALLTDAILQSQSDSVFTHSRKRTLRHKRTRTLLKMTIGFLFCLRFLVSGHPMYNN